MKELVKIHDYKGNPIVSARELHKFLESKRQFGNWIKQRIETYGFIENTDYSTFNKIVKRANGDNRGGSKRKEYALTLDCAKQLAMVENNEKGKQARLYFIECEKKLREGRLLPDFNDPAAAARAWANQYEQRKLAEKEVARLQPKADYADKVLKAKGAYTTTQIAKELGMSAVLLNEMLHKSGIQYSVNGQWVLYARYQSKGYTKTRTSTFKHNDGQDGSAMSTLWTEKGREFIHSWYRKNVTLN